VTRLRSSVWCSFLGWGVDPGGVGLGGVDLLGDGGLSAFMHALMLLLLLA
jgi:hypothetical protein